LIQPSGLRPAASGERPWPRPALADPPAPRWHLQGDGDDRFFHGIFMGISWNFTGIFNGDF